jgi:crossover junction endodeoxyribonuclease RuvC
VAVLVVLGVDPSSTRSGLAAILRRGDENEIVHIETFARSKDEEIQHAMARFKGMMEHIVTQHGVEKIVVELVAVQHNLNTVRKIAYFEAMAMLVASQMGLDVEQIRTTSALKRVTGTGRMDKPDRQKWVLDHTGRHVSEDEADAVIFALC